MEEWEDESIPDLLKKEPPKTKSMWDDEDVDDNDVKESWEDEDEPAVAPKEEPPAEKAPKKSTTKPSEKEKKGKAVEVAQEVKSDPSAEKLHQQRLVEEADYKSTTELFGKRGDEKNLDSFIPKSESDFSEYAELISHKLRPFEKSYHYNGLLKAVMRLSMVSLKGADAKEVASSVSAIANEKIKAEKEANTGKKKTGGAKKKQLHVDKDEDVVVDAYDAFDDYDFM